MMNSISKHLCLIFVLLAMIDGKTQAAPFQSCPSKAFLIQQTTAQLYGVNLVTGGFSLLSSDLGTTDRINGFGFNFHDNYLYGWGYEWGTVVQIGDDFQAQPLTITNLPNTNFFVGDIALDENAYYVYNRDSAFGLYRISLDSSSPDYLESIRVIDGSSLNLRIYDLAFHPDNGFAYSVDADGNLHQINVSDGSSSNLGDVGQTGTFGAVYFDVDGNFYISRNSDGYVFRIDVSAPDPFAEFFTYGPSSSQNDGARCAIAPIVDYSEPATTDFGDAPDSYGTTLFNNGARHGIGDVYLGDNIDGEYNANVYPAEDDLSGTDDEDGLIFITPLIAGLDSLVQIRVTGTGYLNIWGDWNQDGVFDESERMLLDEYLSDTTQVFLLNTSITALEGATWVRARISSTQGIVANGGVADGEVEDYRVTVLNEGYSQIQHSPYYLAFEDNWPVQGDYDMNDVVIKQNSSVLVTPQNTIKQLEITGSLVAMGAGYKNGYAIQLDGISPLNVDTASIRFEINGEQQPGLIETETEDMVLMISEDLNSEVTESNNCEYHRTDSSCSQDKELFFTLKVPFITPIANNAFPQAPFNPFIFATPGTWHGAILPNNPGRELEIHLKNRQPTSKANIAWLALADDASDPDTSLYYQTTTGLPWALAISPGSGNDWKHPLERVDFLQAYPKFEDFVSSNGANYANWYEAVHANSIRLYPY